jgi:hypothetical protein
MKKIFGEIIISFFISNRPYPKTNLEKDAKKEDAKLKLAEVSQNQNLKNDSLPFLNEEDEYSEKKEETLSMPNHDVNDLGKFLAGKKSKESSKLETGIQFPPRPKSIEVSRQIDKRTEQFQGPQLGIFILNFKNSFYLINKLACCEYFELNG